MFLTEEQKQNLRKYLFEADTGILRCYVEDIIEVAGKGNGEKAAEILGAFAVLPTDLSGVMPDRLLRDIPNGAFKTALKGIYQYYSGSDVAVSGFQRVLISDDSIDPRAISNAFRNETIRFLEDTARQLREKTHDSQTDETYMFRSELCNPALIDAFIRNAFPPSPTSEQEENKPIRGADARCLTGSSSGVSLCAAISGSSSNIIFARLRRRDGTDNPSPLGLDNGSAAPAALPSSSPHPANAYENGCDHSLKVVFAGDHSGVKLRARALLFSSSDLDNSVSFTSLKRGRIRYTICDAKRWDMLNHGAYFRDARLAFCFVDWMYEVRRWETELRDYSKEPGDMHICFLTNNVHLKKYIRPPDRLFILPKDFTHDDLVSLIDNAGRWLLESEMGAAPAAGKRDRAEKPVPKTGDPVPYLPAQLSRAGGRDGSRMPAFFSGPSSSASASRGPTSVNRASEPEYNYLFKVLFTGNAGRQISQVFKLLSSDGARTIGIDFVPVLENRIKYQIWDTTGHERYASIFKAYSRGAKIVFCFINSESEMYHWKQRLESNLEAGTHINFVAVGDAPLDEESIGPHKVLRLREGFDRNDIVALIDQAGRRLTSKLADRRSVSESEKDRDEPRKRPHKQCCVM